MGFDVVNSNAVKGQACASVSLGGWCDWCLKVEAGVSKKREISVARPGS